MNFHIILPVWYEGTRFTTEVWVFWLYSLFDVKSPHREHLKNTLDTRFKLSCLFLMWISRLCYLFMWNHTFNNGNICKKLWILWNLLIKWEAKLTNLSEIFGQYGTQSWIFCMKCKCTSLRNSPIVHCLIQPQWQCKRQEESEAPLSSYAAFEYLGVK